MGSRRTTDRARPSPASGLRSRRRPATASAVAAAAVAVLALTTGCSGFLGDPPAEPSRSGAVGSPDAGSPDAGSPTTAANAPAPTTTDPSREVQTAAADLTAKRVDALATNDRKGWVGTVADAGNEFGIEQGGLFDAMAKLPLGRLTTRNVAVEPRPGASDATSVGSTWVANLRLAYQLQGYDHGDRVYRLSYQLTRTTDGWRFSGTGPGPNDLQPFDLPGLDVVSSPSTLVIGNAPSATLRAYLALGDTAHDRITAVWGQAVPGVLVVAKTADELAAQLGVTKDSLAQVAGVTNGPTGDGAPADSDRVYINPDATAKLSQVGRQVIVTHELTHVTTRATTVRRPPTWLSEGFADYVGLKSSGLPVASVASALLDEVRAGRAPTALPGAVAFDPAQSTIEPAYNRAWLAVMLIRRTYGEEKVVAFYRAVSGTTTAAPASGTSADDLTRAAFQSVLGTTQDAFVADWLAYLGRLAR